jgi:hypothetical protein
MKYIAALLLALVGIGIFPVYQRSLFTPVGLLFAAMSVALFVIAYRLVRPRSKDPTADPHSSPSDTGAGQLEQVQSRPKQPSAESDERLWSAALAEVDGQSRRPGLWAKAFSEAGGNESAAKAAYLKARVAELEDETRSSDALKTIASRCASPAQIDPLERIARGE